MGNHNRRISISFKKEHQHIYNHLMTVSNKSHFIALALEAYISGDGKSSISHEEVRRIITDILQEQSNPSQVFIQPLPPSDNQISREDVDLLSQLFR
jgi:hypothetical protein